MTEVGHDMIPDDDKMPAMLTVAGFSDVSMEDRPDGYLTPAQPGWKD